MSTNQSQDVQWKIGEQNFTLRFSLRAMTALKTRWELKTDKEISQRIGRCEMSDLVTVIWAMFRTHHKELSEDQVMGLLDDVGMEELPELLSKVLEASTVPMDAKKKTDQTTTT